MSGPCSKTSHGSVFFLHLFFQDTSLENNSVYWSPPTWTPLNGGGAGRCKLSQLLLCTGSVSKAFFLLDYPWNRIPHWGPQRWSLSYRPPQWCSSLITYWYQQDLDRSLLCLPSQFVPHFVWTLLSPPNFPTIFPDNRWICPVLEV